MLKQSIFFFLIQILAILLCAEQPATSPCPDGIRVRKEFRDMSYSEWRRFKNAVRKLQDVDNGLQYDRWTATHLFHSVDAHRYSEIQAIFIVTIW